MYLALCLLGSIMHASMMQSEFLDIPYTPPPPRDSFREFDLYVPHSELGLGQQPLICFIHGGAWRAEDKADHSGLARKLASFTKFPVIVPNYRLTATDPTDKNLFRHPGHAEDILEFLSFIVTWQGVKDLGRVYDPQRIYLMGHSCSAHMLASIFLDSSTITPTLTPSSPVLEAVQAVIMSEGIYDLDLLLFRFPPYRQWFIENAFGQRQSYADFSTIKFPLRNKDIRWQIIHSKGDSLVDMAQSEAMYNHLDELYDSAARVQLMKNMEELDEEHDDILRGEAFVHIVGEFIIRDSSRQPVI